MPYSDKQRLACDFFGGDRDVDIRAQSFKIVVTRKPHFCPAHNEFKAEMVPAGTRMLVERAVVDGEWGVNYVCVDCIDAWLKQIGEEEEE